MVNGNRISKGDLIRISCAIRKAEEAGEFPEFFSFFDRWTLVALVYFVESKVDAIVLETGLGGRFDSTNALSDDAVNCCLLTSISLDHQEFLGDTVEQIAWQKAGIIKPSAAVVTCLSQSETIRNVFRSEATLRGSRSFLEVEAPQKLMEILSETKNQQFNIHHARYQLDNAALVWSALVSVCPHLEPSLPDLFTAAISSLSWPCRFETFPVPMSSRTFIIIDGAHNEDSVDRFYEGLAQFRPEGVEVACEIWSLFGSGETRNWAPMVRKALSSSSKLVVGKSQHYRAMDPQKLAAGLGGAAQTSAQVWQGTVEAALLDLIRLSASEVQRETPLVIAVCGSLFVAAEARSALCRAHLAHFSDSDPVRDEDRILPSNYK